MVSHILQALIPQSILRRIERLPDLFHHPNFILKRRSKSKII